VIGHVASGLAGSHHDKVDCRERADEVNAYFTEMGRLAVDLVISTQEVLLSGDPEKAARIDEGDDAMDDLHSHLFTVLMDREWKHGVAAAVDVTLLGFFIGDDLVKTAARTSNGEVRNKRASAPASRPKHNTRVSRINRSRSVKDEPTPITARPPTRYPGTAVAERTGKRGPGSSRRACARPGSSGHSATVTGVLNIPTHQRRNSHSIARSPNSGSEEPAPGDAHRTGGKPRRSTRGRSLSGWLGRVRPSSQLAGISSRPAPSLHVPEGCSSSLRPAPM
jgi:hypothetical protein